MRKIAIIGASFGQKDLCIKAKEMGLYTICFAWEKGALCKDIVDRFYPISIIEKERIVEACKKEKIDGVITNASDLPTEISAYVSEQLGLIGNPYETIKTIEDKSYCRKITQTIEGLSSVDYYLYDYDKAHFLPCVIKPKSGGGKTGVSFATDNRSFEEAISYAQSVSDEDILVEEYVEGNEVSVESISYQGKHYVVQVTDKDNSGPPHFVELGHHQPSALSVELRRKISIVVKQILEKIGFMNGASHVELRVTNNQIYLIEVNPRGGGDHISNKLVSLSTGYDYVKAMIDVALGQFEEPVIVNSAYSGIYFLCKQTEYLLPLFDSCEKKDWIIEKEWDHNELEESKGNSTRNGYLIYRAGNKISLKNELSDRK